MFSDCMSEGTGRVPALFSLAWNLDLQPSVPHTQHGPINTGGTGGVCDLLLVHCRRAGNVCGPTSVWFLE